jgi:hypothetical protein
MVSSQITSLGSRADIYLLARSTLNVGKSSLGDDAGSLATGISTAGGGKINIYAGSDINVNESRVMTYLGGDITIWADQGDVNAGRGAKTAISPNPPRKVWDASSKTFITKFVPPAIGSGIRAVTFDPNTTPGGELAIPDPGDIYLFAPQGVIDAGEAGIAGGKVILGATEVLNAAEISSLFGSVGVPSGAEGAVSLGALAGAGSVSEAGKMAEQAAISTASEKSRQANVVDNFLSKWLDVKVIGFDVDSEQIGGDRDSEEEKEKKNR